MNAFFLVAEIENILLLKSGRCKNPFPCFIEHYSGHPNNNGIKMQRGMNLNAISVRQAT